MDFKLLCDSSLIVSETPIHDSETNRLYYTDLLSGDIRCFDLETGLERIYKTHQPIGGIGLCTDKDHLFCAIESGMYVLDLNSAMLDFIINPEKRPGYKFNDTRIDPMGRIFTSSVSKYFGTDRYSPDQLGAFYMIDTDLSVHTLAEGIVQYNGIVWNNERNAMFVVDTGREKLVRFDYSLEKGAYNGPVDVLELSPYGMPDGIAIDARDNMYICHWSSKISIWDRNLKLKEIIDTPVEQISCAAVTDYNGGSLIISTGSYCLTEEQKHLQKGAGGIFIGDLRTKCCKENRFSPP